MKHLGWYLGVWILTLACVDQNKETVADVALAQYVNPFIGTDGPGNTYPGATVPFGMVQLSPDIGIPGWDRIAGYFYQDSIITGFSHLHLTGTGAGDLYDILVMPTNSRFDGKIEANNYKPFSRFSHDDEGASPGYYWVDLLDYGIKAEMTSTARVGVQRYTFPKDTNSKIHIDLGYALNWDAPTDTHLEVVNDSTVQGYRFSTGWARNQKVFFEMRCSKPFASYTLDNTEKNSKIVLEYVTNDGEQITLKTGLSSISAEAAGKAIDTEATEDFDTLRAQANNRWEKELQKIKISSENVDQKTVFYTMLYQSMLAPTLYSDINGEYKAANDAEGKFREGQDTIAKADGFLRYDTFSLWDTFRAAHPLYTLVQQERIPDMIKSLLAHYQETGVLPVWSMQGSETHMMIGYHAVPVIVDAYFKGFDFDATLAYQACKAAAMMNDREIEVYKQKGFIPVDEHHENWSVSKTMEYAYDDWCIAMFAKDLGLQEDYEYFLKRSSNWKNLYNDQNTWFQPKDSIGNFIEPFVPKEYSPYFCESNAWQYYWFVPHDIKGLIAKTGGEERFTQKLDSMFSYVPEPDDKLPIFSTGMIGQYAHGNEPSHHVAYLYNHVGRPSKTQELVYDILENQYRNQPNGHCGNEDCGQMSAWYIFGAMGFYPVNPAQGAYHLGVPLFEEVKMDVGKNKTFIVKAENLEGNPYVSEITLNGKKLDRSYITHKEIMIGGTLVFTMTDDAALADARLLELPETNTVYH
ncbi:MAG: GH92 family glycosyl hydrolase [Bacteroidota bacterium]